jgi:alkylhydroperoxidase/carboxymuconolactone decarboxylase family protein YurZ
MRNIFIATAVALTTSIMANAENPTKLTEKASEINQTAGRAQLGEFAPKFAELNDDVLFGQVWSRTDKLALRDRSLVTVTSLERRLLRY